MSLSLNARQQKFVVAYIKLGNATQAAIAAGYSARTAKQIGSRLLTNVAIASAITLSVADQGISLERWAKETARLAFDVEPSGEFTHDHKLKSLDLLGKHLGAFHDTIGAGRGLSIVLHLGGPA
ncbi:MAG: terminase small subunit [Candidatus Acidiferrales bacterium]